MPDSNDQKLNTSGGEKRRGLQVLFTVLGYVLILVVLLSIAPVLCPKIFGYNTYQVNADNTDLMGKKFTVVYAKTKNLDCTVFENGNILAVADGKHTVDVHYVASNDTTSEMITFQDGSSAAYSDVVGQIRANTPLIGLFAQLCFSAIGIIILIVLFVVALAFMIYANKIGKENNQIAKNEKSE